MNIVETLIKIRTICEQLLAIAEERTTGKWYGVDPTGDTPRNDSWLEISNDKKLNRATASDLAFIASCAGPAEAGWRATIAAINSIIADDPRYQEMFNLANKDLIDNIINAWKDELS